jgi:hypothetical protein
MNKLLAKHEIGYIKNFETADWFGENRKYTFIEDIHSGKIFGVDIPRDEDTSGKYLIGPDTVEPDSEEFIYDHVWFI